MKVDRSSTTVPPRNNNAPSTPPVGASTDSCRHTKPNLTVPLNHPQISQTSLISIIIGGALVNHTSWASSAAALTFGALVLVDLLQFAAVVNAGPILRDLYLSNILLWFVIHLMMTTGVIAGRHSEAGL